MPVVVYVDQIQGLDPLLARLSGHKAVANRILINILRDLSMYIKAGAMKNLAGSKHVKTRATLQSIDAVLDQTRMMATIGVRNIVGLFLEKGTKPHAIVARNAAMLVLPVSSSGSFTRSAGQYRATGSLRAKSTAQVAFFKSVHHPGNKPMPFLHPAYLSSAPFREALLKLAGAEITKYLAGKVT